MILAIDNRLVEWARWATKREDNGLGYPRQTIEAELVRMGGVLIRGDGGPRRVEGNPQAEETEIAVRSLPEPMRTAIVLRYLFRGTREEKTNLLEIRVGGMYSVRDYSRLISQAHVWLDGYFTQRRRSVRCA